MPEITDNYIWIPVRSADSFAQDSFRQITLSEDEGIHARIGKLQSDPDGSTVVQSYYFDKDKWSSEKAQAWVKDNKKSSAQGMQRRYIEHITRMDFSDQKNPKIEGYAAVFNQRTEIWPGFWEQISPGAFTDAIKSDDIYALLNHDPSNILGNTGSRTLTLSEDDHGLKYQIIPPDTTLGRDTTTLIKRGDLRKSSFGFNIEEFKDKKLSDEKAVLRTIIKVKPLYDVSPVTFPAYPQTEVHVRMIQLDNECLCLDGDRIIEIPQPKLELELPSAEELDKRYQELKRRLM